MFETAASCYAAGTNTWATHAALEGSLSCEVCVIGGGITGCAAALNLAERGYRVALLEAGQIGQGGSGRSGGQMIYGYARDVIQARPLIGRDGERQLWALAVEALAVTRRRILKHGIACDFTPGHMTVAGTQRQRRALLAEQAQLARDHGYGDLQFLDGGALRAAIASPRYCAGLYDPAGGHLNPLHYTRGLARAALAAGAQIFENTQVTKLDHGATVVLTTPRARVRSGHVVLAGGAYLGDLVPAMRRRIMPVRTYITATEPLPAERARALLPHNWAVCDASFVLDYFRRSADHRLLFGGRVSYSSHDPPHLATVLRRRMLAVFPQLAAVRQSHTWGGYVDITRNRFPDFGRLAPNVWYAQGFSGHGIALTGLAGELLAEAVSGQAERFDVLARLPHRDFPGGPLLRTPLLVLAMAWFRLRDLL